MEAGKAANGNRTLAKDINLAALIEHAFASPLARFAWLLAMALLTRASTFGDPNYHNDELLFFLIGQRMHDGLIPYVDIWDRKGPGLFAIYYLVSGTSESVIAYQLAACLFAAITALLVNLIAERFASRAGALLAATLYLVMLPLFQGGGGQAPVFYNLFTATAAWIVFARLAELRQGILHPYLHAAMASAGFALTFKQTAVVEGAFLGCVVLWQLHRGGMSPGRLLGAALRLALAGAAPMLGFAAIYLCMGHFAEFWHALVTSNLAKPYNPGDDALKRVTAMALIATPLLLPAAATLALPPSREGPAAPRLLLAGWIAAALGGVAIIPNYIDHYMLPALLPLAVAAAPFLSRGRIGGAYGLFALLIALMAGPSLDFAERRASREAMARLVADIAARDPRPRLFVYQGPVHLYSALGASPPTPLIFPVHLFHRPERNTSHLDTAAEVRKILAWRPTIVVRADDFPRAHLNSETGALVDDYLRRCRQLFTRTIIDYYGPQKVNVYGDCAGPEPRVISRQVEAPAGSEIAANKR